MEVQVSSNIAQLLLKKGESRLIPNNLALEKIANTILRVDLDRFPGLWIKFIEQVEICPNTFETRILLKASKWENSPANLSQVIKSIGSFIGKLEFADSEIGIQEVECGEPDGYYFLIYTITEL